MGLGCVIPYWTSSRNLWLKVFLKDLPAHEVEGPGDLVCAVVDLLVAGVVLVRVGLDPLVGDYVAGRRLKIRRREVNVAAQLLQ